MLLPIDLIIVLNYFSVSSLISRTIIIRITEVEVASCSQLACQETTSSKQPSWRLSYQLHSKEKHSFALRGISEICVHFYD